MRKLSPIHIQGMPMHIQAYTPTSTSSEEKIKILWNDLQKGYRQYHKRDIIIRDFHAYKEGEVTGAAAL